MAARRAANSNHFAEEVRDLVGEASPALQWLCLDATAIGDIDYSAAQTLLEIRDDLKQQGVTLVFADVADEVRAELDRFGITESGVPDLMYDTVEDAIVATTRAKGA